MTTTAVLACTGLGKTYAEGGLRAEIFRDLDLAVAAGETVAIVGASGAGKSTLLRMLAGLSQPNSGRIVVDGEPWFDSAKKINLPPQQRAIGFVFQDYALFSNLTVRQNVAYAADKGQASWVVRLLAMTGLTELQDSLPARLSGGQKQRVALARALARKPKLLLLDEPLSALDGALRAQLQDE
ncbi:MAG: ABC transporter ATP-binding protein, partial [Xanthomonadaceae bacterium]|nr:ABC transporter ATP-binding protein [Xanthomonadaceae bacterium]